MYFTLQVGMYFMSLSFTEFVSAVFILHVFHSNNFYYLVYVDHEELWIKFRFRFRIRIIGDMIANKYPNECRQCPLFIYTKDALSDEKRKSTDTLFDAHWIRRDCLFSCFYCFFLRPFSINIYIFPKIRFSWHLSKRTAQSGLSYCLLDWEEIYLILNSENSSQWKNMHFMLPPKIHYCAYVINFFTLL